MKGRFGILASVLATLAIAPSVALAHTGVGHASGFLHGVEHPITGLDHILAMVTVGIFAYQLGGRALWLVPSTFVGVMALGGVLGMTGVDVPFVELGIAVSVVVLGVVVALGVKAPHAAAMAMVGFFAIFHGHAHGAEIPGDAGSVGYGLGFVIVTTLLHLSGIGIGFAVGKTGDRHGAMVPRSAGAIVAVAGVAILTGAV